MGHCFSFVVVVYKKLIFFFFFFFFFTFLNREKQTWNWEKRWLFSIGNGAPREMQKNPWLTLKAPIATKVVCFSSLLKCLRSPYG